jgi:hypothetical protein
MPETTAQRRAAGRKAAATRKRHIAEAEAHKPPRRMAEAEAHKQPGAVERTTDLSEEVFTSLESAQRAAIEAVRRFMDTVDKTLPRGETPTKRQDVVDSAMEMADRLVHIQYDFLRRIVADAGKALNRSTDGKEDGK